MTTIRTSCPRCGEVEVRADDVLLTLEPGSGEGAYSFACPVCEEIVEKPADRKIAGLLRSVGVGISERPEGLPRAPERDRPPFTLDDVIDFHFLLARDDWFARLMASAG